MESSGELSFQFQLGLAKDRITVDYTDLNLNSLKSLAADFVGEKFPNHGVSRLQERILIFRHDYAASNILQMINSVSDVQEDTVVEIVISAQQLGDDDVEIRPHTLSIHSYKTPTFCHFCGEMLFGMFKQGLKCEGCGLNYHKRCVFKIPNDCSRKKRRPSFTGGLTPTTPSGSTPSLFTSSSVISSSASVGGGELGQFLAPPNARDGSVSPGSTRRERTPSVISAGRPAWVDQQMAQRPKIPHTFVIHTYTIPTKCHLCKKMLVGVYKQGVQCKDCRYNAHKKCSEKVPKDCTGEIPDDVTFAANAEKSGVVAGQGDLLDSDEDDDANSGNGGSASGASDDNGNNQTAQGAAAAAEARFGVGHTNSTVSQSNIPVQRLVQSVKQTKRIGSKILKEGWLVHYTNKGTMRKKHYWRLDTKSLTLFQSDTGTNYYKEIPLSEILAVETVANKNGTVNSVNNNSDSGISIGGAVAETPKHFLEIRTANVDYYVGELSERSTAASAVETARQWELAIRQALMPVVQASPGGSGESTAAKAKDETDNKAKKNNNTADSGASGAAKTAKGGNVNTVPAEQEASAQAQGSGDISQSYQIFPDEVLGSGQFGIVYAGVHRTSGHSVAIKVIDKLRFPTKQEAALKNEVSILQNLHHPGVVNLERMFETPERIFVVMEKLKGDMLEMILSSEMGRLSERITRFIVTQILVALKHLHSKNIVHCDLKPENVLLSSDSDFPQVKLCDFGFARIIGERSFRKSVVGTPAYLAPEVLRNKGYNRSLDMWSTGVIIYVSLSGTFPFNEDEDITEQIQNAAFMYPPHPWKEISSEAMDLIGNLLQVKTRKRISVEKSLIHPWLDNYDTWRDIRELESKKGTRWLTHESDDSRWEQHPNHQKNLTANLANLQV